MQHLKHTIETHSTPIILYVLVHLIRQDESLLNLLSKLFTNEKNNSFLFYIFSANSL